MNTNVAILLTPPQPAAIAVVRLAGPLVEAFLKSHFSKPVSPGRCVHGEIHDGERVLDDAVVVLSAPSPACGGGPGWGFGIPTAVTANGPHPNPPPQAGEGTRESFADLNLHGGPWVVRSVLDLAGRNGFAVIDRTDFPLPDAAREGATPLQREIFAALPLATTELAIRTLLNQETAWQSPIDDRDEMLADRSLWWLLHPPRVALVGAPNVGKSTLANQLFAQERSITADVPGTTRDWVGETANLDGLAVVLVDTPGIRQTTDAIESAAIDQAAGEVNAADLIVLVLDVTREDQQKELLEKFPNAMRVLNKSDLSIGWDAPIGTEISAKTGAGVDDLRQAIRQHFHIDQRPGKPKWWTLEQRASLPV